MRCSVALLGISQRQIRAGFDVATGKSQQRNRIPTNPQTIGDWIHVSRINADLSQKELAELAGVGQRRVQHWERSRALPTAAEMAVLSQIMPRFATAAISFHAAE